jgi:hypothetical protein
MELLITQADYESTTHKNYYGTDFDTQLVIAQSTHIRALAQSHRIPETYVDFQTKTDEFRKLFTMSLCAQITFQIMNPNLFGFGTLAYGSVTLGKVNRGMFDPHTIKVTQEDLCPTSKAILASIPGMLYMSIDKKTDPKQDGNSILEKLNVVSDVDLISPEGSVSIVKSFVPDINNPKFIKEIFQIETVGVPDGANKELSNLSALGEDHFVNKNEAQNITGVKTFTVSPIIPTPTTDFQPATKAYVDSQESSGANKDLTNLSATGENHFVNLTSAQTINGNKTIGSVAHQDDLIINADTTFNGLTILNDEVGINADVMVKNGNMIDLPTAPTNPTDVANKAYVDSMAGKVTPQAIMDNTENSATVTRQINQDSGLVNFTAISSSTPTNITSDDLDIGGSDYSRTINFEQDTKDKLAKANHIATDGLGTKALMDDGNYATIPNQQIQAD